MGLFRKGKTCIIAKFYMIDLLICSHSREGKTPSYSQINTIMHPPLLTVQSFWSITLPVP